MPLDRGAFCVTCPHPRLGLAPECAHAPEAPVTEALPHDQPMDAVRPINPFLVTPNELDTTE